METRFCEAGTHSTDPSFLMHLGFVLATPTSFFMALPLLLYGSSPAFCFIHFPVTASICWHCFAFFSPGVFPILLPPLAGLLAYHHLKAEFKAGLNHGDFINLGDVTRSAQLSISKALFPCRTKGNKRRKPKEIQVPSGSASCSLCGALGKAVSVNAKPTCQESGWLGSFCPHQK